jgi:fructose-1,6-bisphosphatase/inositol monophosphatase family enzyme
MQKIPEALPRFMRYVGSYRKVRMIGTSALSLAYVACGRLDVYAERVMLWDAAAGAALVLGAGGVATVRPCPGTAYVCQSHGCGLRAATGACDCGLTVAHIRFPPLIAQVMRGL